MKLQHIPVDQLKVSKLNMRHERRKPDISDILPSIRERGVRQTLLVRKEGDHYGVVAGRRRLFALKQVAKETGKSLTAPCGVLGPGDDAEAIEDSLLENIARLPPGEFQQYDAFARLVQAGKSAEDIAATFGVTELKVRRVLALANLSPDIKRLYEDDKIDAGTLRALTLATPDQQESWLKLFADPNEHAPRGERLKAWLTGGARILTKAALFDLAAYDGHILTDLFGDSAIFADPDLFWSCQNAAITERIEAYKAAGWQVVEILERGAFFSSWEYVKLPKAKGGRIYVETRHDGTVTFHEGYVSQKEAKRLEGTVKGEKASAPSEKPEMSGPLGEYVTLHRHAAIRARLPGHPGVALRLAVAHLLIGSSLWRIEADPQRTRKQATADSLAASKGERLMREEAGHVCAMLGFENPERGLLRQNGDGWTAAMVFSRLLKMDDSDVLRILALAMAESLEAGSPVVEALAQTIEPDLCALWTPDEAFFDLLRDKRVINAMVADIAGEAAAKACLTETAKAQKQIIRNRIDGKGGDPFPDWRPRWMTDIPTAYLATNGSPPVAAAEKARSAIAEGKKAIE